MLHTAKPNETRCFRWEPESPESRAMWKTNIWISALPSNIPEQSGQDRLLKHPAACFQRDVPFISSGGKQEEANFTFLP